MTDKIRNIVRQDPANSAIILAISSALIVGAAWLFQIAGYLPCQLCLWQRIPYYIVAPLLALVAIVSYAGWLQQNAVRKYLIASGLIFVSGTILAGYHSGVEWGYWAGPTSCGAGADYSPKDASDLLSSLSTVRPPSCNEAAGRFMGLSFAGWNTVASAGLAFACISVARASLIEHESTK